MSQKSRPLIFTVTSAITIIGPHYWNYRKNNSGCGLLFSGTWCTFRNIFFCFTADVVWLM